LGGDVGTLLGALSFDGLIFILNIISSSSNVAAAIHATLI
jgi:hypothetical protein